jgi:5'-nucleotidase
LHSDTPNEWSYNFDGQAGSLDHVIGNDAATTLVTGVDIWESNANETVFRQYSRFNYNITDFYAANQFSASDHNPEVVGIELPDPQPGDSTTTVAADPASVKVLSGTTELTATVAADDATPTGDVEFFVDDESVGTATLTDGVARLSVGPFDTVGAKAVEARYVGSGTVNPSTGSASFDVVKRTPAMTVKKKPARVVVKRTKAKLVVLLKADGGPVNGKVKVRVAGNSYTATVTDGRAVVTLKPFKKTGKYTAKVRFLANATDNTVYKTVPIKVVRR